MKLNPLAEYWLDECMTSCLRHMGINRFSRTVFQRSSDFKIFLLFFLHCQLFETNQNTEKSLSILMGLKGGDCVWSGLCKSGNLSNSNVSVA